MAAPRYPGFRSGEPEPERLEKLNNILRGKLNNSTNGTVTLTANAASTTLTDPLITPVSVIPIHPTTANAAGALATTYVSSQTNGSAVLTHANNAQADKTFRYVVLG